MPNLEICAPAQPFLAALLRGKFPRRPIVIVTDSLKTQESFQQDLETWSSQLSTPSRAEAEQSRINPQLLFYPAWEVFPHEGKLPHADVISDRLQTLIALTDESKAQNPKPTVVITSVTALLQKTFAPADLKNRTRRLQRGDQTAPLDLIDWLETQGYEPEAQVTQKGEIALRGGIVDIFPPTSPWPVRLDFFGDELESLREFDPLTQISRGEIPGITLPPAGELGILKQQIANPEPKKQNLATLLDHLPSDAIFLLCEPEQLALRADEYAAQIPANDPCLISWPDFLAEIDRRGMSRFEMSDTDVIGTPSTISASITALENQLAVPAAGAPLFTSLAAFRPLGERAPEPQIVEAQRREFFQQLHRWLRQDYAVHVFCNNDGERQRFEEIWKEISPKPEVQSPKSDGREQLWTLDIGLWTHLGSLARGFICDEAKLVVVTDAEIFGRYKIQRPRRQKSSHALAVRSAMEIDFADLEEGDLVVHLQHGIGRYLGLKNMPVGRGARGTELSIIKSEPTTGTECLVIEYAAGDDVNEPPKLYVPVSEAHLVSKYVGAGKANPPLNMLGGTRWS